MVGAPAINHQTLIAKGLTPADLENIEKSLLSAFELQFVFNNWTLGEETMARLGFSSEQYLDPNFNFLKAIGFNDDELEIANEFVCGAMAIEGAPHLKTEHYKVFDTANKNGKKGKRFIHYLGHIRMMAAVQPFLSGAISKTINMPNEATVEDVKIAYMASWKLALKANAIYRDGCKMSQPLASKSDSKKDEVKEEIKLEEKVETISETITKTFSLSSDNKSVVNQLVEEDKAQINYAHDGSNQGTKIYIHGEQRRLPYKRSGITIKAKIAGQKIFVRTGEYPDGRLGEVFIDMYREGAAFRSLLNLFAISISTGLQHGVPLEEYVDKFTFTRFEPAGMTDHPNIKSCTSIIDFVFRLLGMEYLGRTDFVQVKPNGIQKNRAHQLEQFFDKSQGQQTLDFEDAAVEVEDVQVQMEIKTETNKAVNTALSGAEQMLAGMMGDAPPCPTCGHITIRNGSCYKCLNCGSTTGCS